MRPRIGISSCLLGQRVRYDGAHKRVDWLSEVVAPLVDFVPVCPEVELGLGVPRPPMRLERGARAATRLVVIDTGEDLTARMRAFANERARALLDAADPGAAPLAGFVLKSRSPSCGDARVNRFAPGEPEPTADGRGLFADALHRAARGLPTCEEDVAADPARAYHFCAQVALRARLDALRAATDDDLELHELYVSLRNELLLYVSAARLEDLDEQVPALTPEALARELRAVFARPPTRAGHLRALRSSWHILGGERAQPAAVTESFARQLRAFEQANGPLLPLLDLLAERSAASGADLLEGDTYCHPHPLLRAALQLAPAQ